MVDPDPGRNKNLFPQVQGQNSSVPFRPIDGIFDEQAVITQGLQEQGNIQPPNLTNNIPNIGAGVSDDDFFHLTCHIDPNLFHKIEKGEFVELEKLLPKDKLGGRDDNRLEWVQKDGGTFLVPAQRDSKISSFRRWEQAFRVVRYHLLWC